MTDNEDKIKILEKALTILELELSLAFGICDAIMVANRDYFQYPAIFRDPKFYGIVLPDVEYSSTEGGAALFSFPCTLAGRQQRIEVLKEAIKKLQS